MYHMERLEHHISHEFKIPGGKSKYKYVHELKSVLIRENQPPYTRWSRLFLILKLEWKGKKKWKVARKRRKKYKR